jgi:DNA-binding CsgD family transcriptional regulator
MKATNRLSLPVSADAGPPETEPADVQFEPVPGPMSPEGARIWRLTLASLRISSRESQIIESILAFADDEASIAARLRMSPSTVQTHLARLYRKVGVTNRWQLVVKLLLAYIAARLTHLGKLSNRPFVSPDKVTPLPLPFPSASPGVPVRWRGARGESLASHRDERGAPRARRDD